MRRGNCDSCKKKPGQGGLDPCLISLIKVLNKVGLKTIASCCGHGHRPGNIALEDGREIIIARNYQEAREIDKLFPVSITGESKTKEKIMKPLKEGIRIDKLDKNQAIIEIKVSNQFKVRFLIAKILMKLAGFIIGFKVGINNDNNQEEFLRK